MYKLGLSVEEFDIFWRFLHVCFALQHPQSKSLESVCSRTPWGFKNWSNCEEQWYSRTKSNDYVRWRASEVRQTQMHIPLKDPKFTQIQSLSSIWSQPNSVIKDISKNIWQFSNPWNFFEIVWISRIKLFLLNHPSCQVHQNIIMTLLFVKCGFKICTFGYWYTCVSHH